MIYLIAILSLLCTAEAEWTAEGNLLQQEEGLWRLSQRVMLGRDTWMLYSSTRQETGETALARLAGGVLWQGQRLKLLAGDIQLRDRLGLLGRGSRLSFPSSAQGLIRPGPATASTWQQGERGVFLETGRRVVLSLAAAQTFRDTRSDQTGYTLDLVRSSDRADRINAWQDQLLLADLRHEGARGSLELLLAARRSLEPVSRKAGYGSLRMQRRAGPLLIGSILQSGEGALSLFDLQLRASSRSVWRLAIWKSVFAESVWSRPVLSPQKGKALALAWQGRIERLRLRAELRHEAPDDGPRTTRLNWECAAPGLFPAGWELVARSSLLEEGPLEAGKASRLLRLEKRSRASELWLEYRQLRDGDTSFSAFSLHVGGRSRHGDWELASRAGLSISAGGGGGAWVPGSTPGLTGSRYLRAGRQVALAGFQLRREENSIALQAGIQERDSWIRLGWSMHK